jgi:hypothetical protein
MLAGILMACRPSPGELRHAGRIRMRRRWSSQLKKALDAAGVPNGQDLVVGGKHGNFSREENEKAMLLCLRFLKANGVIQ